MIVDFTPLQEPEPEDKPPAYIHNGRYLSEIMAVEERVSRAGMLYLAWMIRPEGIHPDFRIAYITSLRPNYLQRLAELIEVITGIKPVGKIEFDPCRLVGSKVVALVGLSEYGDLLRNHVAKVEAP